MFLAHRCAASTDFVDGGRIADFFEGERSRLSGVGDTGEFESEESAKTSLTSPPAIVSTVAVPGWQQQFVREDLNPAT
jgi:hypothetical protein